MRITLKRLAKPRSALKLALVISILYAGYIFGLFTHLFEESFSNFDYPIKIDIQLALDSYYHDLNATKYLDLDELKFPYIHKAEKACQQENGESEPPFLLILVKSKINNFHRRQVIRETWGKSDQKRSIRTVFLAGMPSPMEVDEITRFNSLYVDIEGIHHNAEIIHKKEHNNDINKLNVKNEKILSKLKHQEILYKFELEYEKYGDIVQQNFYDAYYNNTIKTLMGIRWVVDYCPKAKFYLFIDDDFFMNQNLLMKFLRSDFNYSVLEKFYTGFVYGNSSPMRHLMSKWYISLHDYPYNKFPPYVSAGFYILSQQSSKLFYIASKLIKIFKFDDIYMGILAYKLGVKPMHMSNVYYHAPSYYPSMYANEIIAAHGFGADELARIWKQLETFIRYDS